MNKCFDILKYYDLNPRCGIECGTELYPDDIELAEEAQELWNFKYDVGDRVFLKDYLNDKEIAYLTTADHIPKIDPCEFKEFMFKFQFDIDDNSSFNDDGILPSERDYFTSEYEETDVGDYSPPLTRTKKILLEKILQYETNFDKRIQFLKEYQENRLKKRVMRTYIRLKRVKEMDLKYPEEEARILEQMELKDKKLNKAFYYEPEEPETYKELLQKRSKAIHKKYEIYADNKYYRHYYYKKIMENMSSVLSLQELEKFESSGDDEESDSKCSDLPKLFVSNSDSSSSLSRYIDDSNTYSNIIQSLWYPINNNDEKSIKYVPSSIKKLLKATSAAIKSSSKHASSVIQIPKNYFDTELETPVSYLDDSSSMEKSLNEMVLNSPSTLPSLAIDFDLTSSSESERSIFCPNCGDYNLNQREAYCVPKSNYDATCSESSFYDDAVPVSELELFSSDWDSDGVKRPQVKSRRVRKLNKLMKETIPDRFDNEDEKVEKYKKKYEITTQFCDFIEGQRARKAYKRLKMITDRKINNPMEEANVLMEMELKDKKLNRLYYYKENEPLIFTRLLIKRKKAIMNKYDLYGISEQFRKNLKNRIVKAYKNINSAPLFEQETQEDEDISSFDDTEIATSEEEFMSDNEIAMPVTFKKPLTVRKQKLIEELILYIPNPRDNEEIILNKRKERFELIQDFKAEIKEKRNKKALVRIERIDEMGIFNLDKRAEMLMDAEIHDKKLDRGYYYKFIEPEQVREILHKRLRAIKRKYERYIADHKFRQDMEEKIRSGGTPYRKKNFSDNSFCESIKSSETNISGQLKDCRDIDRYRSLTEIGDHGGKRIERKRQYATSGIWPPRRMSAPDEFGGIRVETMSMGYQCGPQTNLSYARGLLHIDKFFMTRFGDKEKGDNIFRNNICGDKEEEGDKSITSTSTYTEEFYSDISYDY